MQLNNILIYGFVVCMIILSVWLRIDALQKDNADLSTKNTELTAKINTMIIEQNTLKKNYEAKLVELPKEIEVIKTKYKTRYEYIQSWEGDSNASECNNTLSFLHSINY